MCLGFPVKIIAMREQVGTAEMNGVTRQIDLRLVPGAAVGDFVLLHAGFAIQKLDPQAAEETLSLLRECAEP